MRKLYFDQFEFEDIAAEESLEIDVARKKQGHVVHFGDVCEFVVASAGEAAVEKLGHGRPFDDRASFCSVRAYLKRFANIDVPHPCDWQMYVLFEDNLEWDGVFESPTMFIRYHWSSTA